MRTGYWTDFSGKKWKVPQALGRLRPGKSPGHHALRAFVIERDGGRCVLCGATPQQDPFGLVADHIVSRRNGGTHHPDNLRALCNSCNSAKAGSEDAGRPLKIRKLGIGVARQRHVLEST